MSDYKQTRDAAGRVTSQYSQMLQNLNDDDLTRRHEHALYKIDVLEDEIDVLKSKLAECEARLEKAVLKGQNDD